MVVYDSPTGEVKLKNWMSLIANRLCLKGFTAFDYMSRMGEATSVIAKGLQDGTLRLEQSEMIIKSPFEDVPKTWAMLFDGRNTGKLITEIIHD